MNARPTNEGFHPFVGRRPIQDSQNWPPYPKPERRGQPAMSTGHVLLRPRSLCVGDTEGCFARGLAPASTARALDSQDLA